MREKHHLTNFRIDKATDLALQELVKTMGFSKSHLIRRSIHLLKNLNSIRLKHGELNFITEKGEKVMVIIC